MVHGLAAVVALILFAPGTLTQVDQSWTEPLLLAGVVWWAVLVDRGRAWWAVAGRVTRAGRRLASIDTHLTAPDGAVLVRAQASVQLLAPYFQEGRLLNVAHQYQQVTDWHTQAPTGF